MGAAEVAGRIVTRVLVTGGAGMLATDLAEVLAGGDATFLSRSELDITDQRAVDAAVDGHDVIVNAAAYTKVDDAESHEADALLVNGEGAGNLARAAARHGARLIQISTDYVFDGTATEPYAESTPRAPVSAYGRTKAEGERLAQQLHPDGTIILRTAWLYGWGGANFVTTMLRLAGERETLTVVDDQVGQPTWSFDLATRIGQLIDSDARRGVFHATNAGRTSWYGFARAIFELSGLDPQRVQPTTSADFVRPAPRPAFSVLGHRGWAETELPPLRDWREALSAALARLPR